MNAEWVLRLVRRIQERQRARRRNPSPEQVWECMEDCETLIGLVEKLVSHNGEEDKKK